MLNKVGEQPFARRRLKFNVIVIDPPWSYNNKKTGGSMKSAAGQKYQTMTIEEIMDLPIDKIADENCILFLWATTPLKQELGWVMQYWQIRHKFKYKTTIYWDKVRAGKRRGMGAWLSGNVEECVMMVRGKEVRATRLGDSNKVTAPVGKHSEKPDEVYDLIKKVGRKAFGRKMKTIDIFARKDRRGWSTIGDAIDGLDVHEAVEFLSDVVAVTDHIRRSPSNTAGAVSTKSHLKK